jgi:hypothetical protein
MKMSNFCPQKNNVTLYAGGGLARLGGLHLSVSSETRFIRNLFTRKLQFNDCKLCVLG